MPYELKYVPPELAFIVTFREWKCGPTTVKVFHTYPSHIIYPQHNHSAKRRVNLFDPIRTTFCRMKYFYTTNQADSPEGWFDIRILLSAKGKERRKLRHVDYCGTALQQALTQSRVIVRFGCPRKFQRIHPETGEWVENDDPNIQKEIAEHSYTRGE